MMSSYEAEYLGHVIVHGNLGSSRVLEPPELGEILREEASQRPSLFKMSQAPSKALSDGCLL
jgi:hypothetical protein